MYFSAFCPIILHVKCEIPPHYYPSGGTEISVGPTPGLEGG